jgi:hypothetical protein
MKTRAAALRDMGKDWEIVEMDLDPPKDGEVLIRFAARACATPTITCAPATSRFATRSWAGTREQASSRRSATASAGCRRRGGRRRRQPAVARRSCGLLVPADLRALPVLRQRHDQPV